MHVAFTCQLQCFFAGDVCANGSVRCTLPPDALAASGLALRPGERVPSAWSCVTFSTVSDMFRTPSAGTPVCISAARRLGWAEEAEISQGQNDCSEDKVRPSVRAWVCKYGAGAYKVRTSLGEMHTNTHLALGRWWGCGTAALGAQQWRSKPSDLGSSLRITWIKLSGTTRWILVRYPQIPRWCN